MKERRQSEEGFTLIELMVVVLIMGILMAIAIPTFLATQGSAHDASAKSNATNAFTNEKAYFESNQVFLDSQGTVNGDTLDPNLPWSAAGTPAVKGQVSALVGTAASGAFTEASSPYTGPVLLVEDLSQSGNCFYIYNDETSENLPVLGYAETSGGTCSASVTGPTAQTAVTAGHAGSAISSSITTWYTKW